MASWSGIRHKLENKYLADSLRGHIQYFATSYSKSPDHEGRAAIRLDGKEIIKGCYYCAFHEFDNQSIEKSLVSEDMIVRIFALLDRRVGKRRLLKMKDGIENEGETIQCFYAIRAAAEQIL